MTAALLPEYEYSPETLIHRDVCPHCHQETNRYRFMTPDGHRLETHHCREHGDVAPMRSSIVNQPFVAALLRV